MGPSHTTKSTAATTSGEPASPTLPSRRDFLKELVALAVVPVSAANAAEVSTSVRPALAPESGSQSGLVWLKVFDAANEELRKRNPGFNGEWRLPGDPLNIGTKIGSSAEHLKKVQGVEGYSLSAVAGFGDPAVEKVNQLFKDHGLSSQLEKRGSSYDGLVAGAVEEIKFPFEMKGKSVSLSVSDTSYKAVAKKDQSFYRADGVSEPIVELPTSNGVGVVMFKASALAGLTSENLLATGEKVLAEMRKSDTDHQIYKGGVHFPEVDFRATTSPSWLIGAQPNGSNLIIDETVLETRFRMDVSGGESTTGAAFMTSRGISRPYKFDEPFVVVTYNKASPGTVLNATLVTESAFVKAE